VWSWKFFLRPFGDTISDQSGLGIPASLPSHSFGQHDEVIVMSTPYDLKTFCVYCNVEIEPTNYVETDDGPAHEGCVQEIERGEFVPLC